MSAAGAPTRLKKSDELNHIGIDKGGKGLEPR